MSEDPVSFYSRGAATFAERNGIDDVSTDYIDLLDRFIQLVEHGSVLDAGCGPGRDVHYFAEAGLDAIGVDAAQPMIDIARQEHKGTYQKMDARDLEFPDGQFDGVWCNSVLVFFDEAERATVLEELVRVLEDEGILYAGFKIGDETIEREKYGSTVEQHLLPRDSSRELLESTGLTILETNETETIGGFDAVNYICKR